MLYLSQVLPKELLLISASTNPTEPFAEALVENRIVERLARALGVGVEISTTFHYKL
jgi:hypothetical protein